MDRAGFYRNLRETISARIGQEKSSASFLGSLTYSYQEDAALSLQISHREQFHSRKLQAVVEDTLHSRVILLIHTNSFYSPRARQRIDPSAHIQRLVRSTFLSVRHPMFS